MNAGGINTEFIFLTGMVKTILGVLRAKVEVFVALAQVPFFATGDHQALAHRGRCAAAEHGALTAQRMSQLIDYLLAFSRIGRIIQ